MKKLLIILSFLIIYQISLNSQKGLNDNPNLSSVGDLYINKVQNVFTSSLDSALIYSNKAISFFEEQKNWKKYVECLNYNSVIYYKKRDFDNFKRNIFHALKVSEKYLTPTADERIKSVNNLGGYYQLTNDLDKGIKLYQNIIESLGSSEDQQLLKALVYENLASLYGLKGDYQTAIRHYDKGISIRRKFQEPSDFQAIYNPINKVRQLRKLNKFDEAFLILKDVEKILIENYNETEGAIGGLYISLYEEFAEIFNLQKDYENMDKYLNKLHIYHRGENKFHQHHLFEIKGDSYLQKKDWEQAFKQYSKSNKFLLAWYGNKNKISVIAESYLRIANSQYKARYQKRALKNVQKAFSYLVNSFDTSAYYHNPNPENLSKRELPLKLVLTKSDILYAMWMESKENAEILQHAYDQYIYLSEFIHQLRFDLLSVKSKQLISEKIVSHFEKAIEISLVLYQQTNDPKHLEQAYHFAEQNKAITLQESIQENLAKGFGGIPDTTLEIEKDMRLEIAFYEKQIYEEKLKGEKTNEEHLKTFESTLFDLKRDYERLVEQLEKEYPKYYELKYKTELPKVAAIQAKLSNGSALIEFFSGEETIYAFVFTKEQLEVIELPKAEGLTDQISQFKDLINNPPVNDRAQKDFQDFTQMGFDLFENILQKPLSILPKSIQQLILIPDGELTYIPFEILLKDLTDKERVNYSLDNLSYLMEDYQVSYSFSSKLWLKNMGQLGGQAKEPFLGFAPVFGQAIADARRDCSADELYSLNCNKEEINTVHDMFGGHIFTDLAASKGNFEDQASNYQILHLATHACLDDENPMFNKIWLSDDYVSNNDLYNLSLNADLAVLSACNTGSGQLVKGEGVQSLARGFLHAGCPSLVTSLWSVDDCATSDIMIRFYEHLKEGNTKNKALQLAKLEYLKEADKLHQHPYYWSAFIQIGNPIALDFVGLNWTFIFVGLGILIVLFFLLKRKSKIEI
jgi:CHAT domain-containing protein